MNKGDKILSYDIEGAAITVGRSPESDIQLRDNYASRSHFILWQSGKKFFRMVERGKKVLAAIDDLKLLM